MRSTAKREYTEHFPPFHSLAHFWQLQPTPTSACESINNCSMNELCQISWLQNMTILLPLNSFLFVIFGAKYFGLPRQAQQVCLLISASDHPKLISISVSNDVRCEVKFNYSFYHPRHAVISGPGYIWNNALFATVGERGTALTLDWGNQNCESHSVKVRCI